MKHLLIIGAAMLIAGCTTTKKSTSPVEAQATPFERFLPLNAESQKSGVPWAGFFALDTQTGQLCRTTTRQFGNEFDQLPTCTSLAQGKPAPGGVKYF
jgi:hypothetical protein